MADSAATALDATTTSFAIEPSYFGGACRLGGVSFLRLHQSCFDQLRKSFFRFTSILFLAALRTRDDQNRAFVGEAPSGETPKSLFDRFGEGGGSSQIETQLDGR